MAKGNFDACLAFVLRFEGGKSNDPKDPGGRTNQGVTQKTYDTWRIRNRLPSRNVYAMEPSERDEIYRTAYWAPIKAESLRLGEDLVVFDYGVNSGPKKAVCEWMLVNVDNASAEIVIHKLCAERLSFLHALRTWSHFGVGWGRRVAACEALAIQMLHGVSASAVLKRKAEAAHQRAKKNLAKATVGGSVISQAGVLHELVGGHLGVTVAISAAFIAIVGVLSFMAWRQSQRASAFKEAAKQ